jgi:hypothetical protein
VYVAPARFCTKDGAPLVDVAGPFSGGRPAAHPMTAPRPPARHGDPPSPPPALPPDAASVLTGSVLTPHQIERKVGEGGMAYVPPASRHRGTLRHQGARPGCR